MIRTILKLAGGVIALSIIGFLAIQLIPINTTNPPIVNEPAWDSPQTRELVQRACFDCHSNETVWPRYSKIAPVSWLIAHDVKEGREHVNYSNYRPNRENESIEVIVKGKMPPVYYTALHPEANLTPAEQEALIAGLRATFGTNVK